MIAGGKDDETDTEIFSWEKNGWFEVSPMNEEHTGASSFTYKDQIFVAGGVCSKTIETLDPSVLPLKWMKFPEKIPYDRRNHQSAVYQERVIHIGGYNYDKGKYSAEIFEDKALILAGQKSLRSPDRLDSVLEFDVKKINVKRCHHYHVITNSSPDVYSFTIFEAQWTLN